MVWCLLCVLLRACCVLSLCVLMSVWRLTAVVLAVIGNKHLSHLFLSGAAPSCQNSSAQQQQQTKDEPTAVTTQARPLHCSWCRHCCSRRHCCCCCCSLSLWSRASAALHSLWRKWQQLTRFGSTKCRQKHRRTLHVAGHLNRSGRTQCGGSSRSGRWQGPSSSQACTPTTTLGEPRPPAACAAVVTLQHWCAAVAAARSAVWR